VTRIVGLTTLVLAFSLIQAVPAQAAKLTGCTGSATSHAKNGSTVDTVSSSGTHGSQSDPFIVDWDGTVRYSGQSNSVITDHKWQVRVFGVPVKSGGSPNTKQEKSTSGEQEIKTFLPFRFTGLYYVDGAISGTGGSCSGWAWVKLSGDPAGTIPWIGAIVFAAIGLIMLILALKKRGRLGHLILGILGGLFLGIGLSVLLISYSKVFFGRLTPDFVVIATLVVGLLIGLFAPTPSSA
jgi:hypothetical protein